MNIQLSKSLNVLHRNISPVVAAALSELFFHNRAYCLSFRHELNNICFMRINDR